MRRSSILRAVAGVGTLAAAAATLAPTAASAYVSPDDELAARLLTVVQDAAFDEVVDFEYDTKKGPAPQVANQPNVDVAVIELDELGAPVASANVLFSRDYPDGTVVALDKSLAPVGVDWRSWDLSRWDGDWNAPWPKGSRLVPGTAGGVPFMVPYPASTFKLLVAYHTLRLIERGKIQPNRDYVYKQRNGKTCLGNTKEFTNTTAQMLEKMITYSSNTSTCALLQQLHSLNQMKKMNERFASLGLATLQVKGTDAGAGGTWNPGQISMTAMDTARLLLLVNGLDGVAWKTEDGRKVVADRVLAPRYQEWLRDLLSKQGFHEVLSTTNWCGADYPVQGMPAKVPNRWIDPSDGTVTVHGIPYGFDVRPCNQTAEIRFLHKTGLTENYGSDAGIVKALPGQDGRQYIVAAFTNLGYRYSDASQADSDGKPCFTSGVCYTEKFAIVGQSIDDLMRRAG
jgi:hypothetical protein